MENEKTPVTFKTNRATYKKRDDKDKGYNKKIEIIMALIIIILLLSIPIFALYYNNIIFKQQMQTNNEILIVGKNARWTPDKIYIKSNTTYNFKIMAEDVTHGFQLNDLNGTSIITFTAIDAGAIKSFELKLKDKTIYVFMCITKCSPEHAKMHGEVIVQ